MTNKSHNRPNLQEWWLADKSRCRLSGLASACLDVANSSRQRAAWECKDIAQPHYGSCSESDSPLKLWRERPSINTSRFHHLSERSNSATAADRDGGAHEGTCKLPSGPAEREKSATACPCSPTHVGVHWKRTSGPIARICRAQAGQQDRKMRSEEETIELLRTISTGETPRNSALKIFTERLHSRFSICFHSASVRASTKSSCRLSHDMGCRPVLPVFFKRFNDEVGHHLVTKRVEVSVVG